MLSQVPDTSYQAPFTQPSGLIDVTRDLGDTSSISSSQIDDFLIAHGILSPDRRQPNVHSPVSDDGKEPF